MIRDASGALKSRDKVKRGDETLTGKARAYVVILNYRDYQGKRRQVRRNARTLDEAREIEADFRKARKQEGLSHQTPPKNPAHRTIESFLTMWIESKPGKANERTLRRYGELMAHVIREAGATPIAEFDAESVARVYNRLRERGLSESTIAHLHRVLRMAMNDAVDPYDVITRNPVSKRLRPAVPRVEIMPPSAEETGRIIEASRDMTIGPLVDVAARTGARLGELMALKWSRVDLRAPRTGAASYIFIERAKTSSGRRRIPLTPEAIRTLRTQRARQWRQRRALGSAWQDSGLVFTDALGAPLRQATIRGEWARIRKAARVSERVRFHDLRHAFACRLLERNVHPKIVSSLLGHSTIQITLDTYSHVLPELRQEDGALADFDRVLA
jgi:integrase